MNKELRIISCICSANETTNPYRDQNFSQTMKIFHLFFVSSLLCSLSKAATSGSVFFIDGSDHRYIRRPSDAGQPQSMLLPEVGAAVSVLLGFPPLTSLSATGSLKLNEVLASNPFERPRAVLMLEVTGIDDPLVVDHDNALFSNSIKSSVEYTNDAVIEFPDVDEVLVVSLDEQVEDHNEKDISNFALLFGGSFVTEGNDLLSGVLTVPLQNGQKLELYMSKEADRKFVLDLLALYNNIRRSIVMHEDFSVNMRRPAELLMGRFDGFKELDGGVSKGVESLLYMISKLFDSLQSAHKGQIVGVILFNGASAEPKRSVSLMFAPQLPLRRLAEEKSSTNATILVKEILLVRKTLAWITGIVLLIATLLGVYFLVNMPLTRDTLLYSNVKLD